MRILRGLCLVTAVASLSLLTAVGTGIGLGEPAFAGKKNKGAHAMSQDRHDAIQRYYRRQENVQLLDETLKHMVGKDHHGKIKQRSLGRVQDEMQGPKSWKMHGPGHQGARLKGPIKADF